MPSTTLIPYLFFSGRCEEAFRFYEEALNAEVKTLMRFGDSPEPAPPGMLPEGWDQKVMHAELLIHGHTLMASDGCEPGETLGGFSLALSFPSEAEVDAAFAALAQEGEVRMPLDRTFWSPRFGMVRDKFGLGWMIGVLAET